MPTGAAGNYSVKNIQADPLALLRTRTSAKWREYPADVLPLWVAEMDYPLAEPIAETLMAAVRRSDTGYIATDVRLPDAFAAFAADRWGWTIDPAQVTTTTDVSVAIVEVLRGIIAPGDGVVISPPVYPPFFDLLPEAGATVVEVPLAHTDEGWSLDLAALEQAFAGGAKAYLLCNPHNPVGHPHPAPELAALASLAAKYGVTVVSDEIHGALALPGATFTPFLSVSDEARAVGVCVTSASKAFNLAGLKCAIIVTASPAHAAVVAGLPREVVVRTGLFGYLATSAAFESGGPWLDGVIGALDESRMLLGQLLSEHLPEVGYVPPAASFLAWLDFNALDWGEDPSVRALDRARVALNPGPSFGVGGEGHLRLNFACSPDVLEEAVRRLASAR